MILYHNVYSILNTQFYFWTMHGVNFNILIINIYIIYNI